MHVFIGGAFNGKRTYVENWLEEQGVTDALWFAGELPSNLERGQVVVISDLDKWLEVHDLSDEEAVATELMASLMEIDREHTLLVIVTDMGRGVVPFEQKARQLRDACGRLYQLLFQESEAVTRIWYGLAEKLK